MNRIDRLFGILLTLQHKSRVRAQDLAEKFEVSKRTIYRDILALYELGVPIVSLPGEGYEIIEGYYLPPLLFKENEAAALILGAQLLRQQSSGDFSRNAEQGLAKISAALPKSLRQRVEALTSIIGFITPANRFNLDDPQLLQLQKAIQNKNVIHIQYHSYREDRVTERTVEPHRLYYSEGIWYLEGYCRLRQGIRSFRLSRIEKLKLGSATFSREISAREEPLPKLIRIRFTQNVLRWVRERQHYAFQSEEVLPLEQGVVMCYSVADEAEITPWLFSWGASAEVLSPSEFREKIRQEILQLANMLT